MFLAPILRHELRALGSRKDTFWLRAICALIPGVIFLIAYGIKVGTPSDPSAPRALLPVELRELGMIGFLVGAGSFAMALISIGAAMTAAPVVAAERQKDTWMPLFLSHLGPWELVGIKLFAPVVESVMLSLAFLPLCVWSGAMWGLTLGQFASLFAALLTTCVFAHVLAFAVGLGALRPDHAQGFAVLVLVVWMIMPIGGAFIPLSHYPVLYELTWAIREALRFFGQSSPVSWFVSIIGPPLSIRRLPSAIVTSMAMQTVLTALLLLYCAIKIRPLSREALSKNEAPPDWSTPFQRWRWKHRPGIGDDPIFWKDRYVLSLRPRVEPSRTLIGRLLTLLLVLWFLMVSGSFLCMWGIQLTSHGIAATREALTEGYFREGGIFTARMQFYATSIPLSLMGGLIGWLAVGASAHQLVMLERDRKTWDSLIMTPLDGIDILLAKYRVATRAGRIILAFQVFFLAWAGLVGSIYWPGVICALALTTAAWRLVALIGIWRGLRTKSTGRATSTIPVAIFPLALFVAPFVVIGLLPQELQRSSMAKVGPALLLLYIAATALVFATLIWAHRRLRRHLDTHFDEWVERPVRPSPAPEAIAPGPEPAGLPIPS